ncbi:MAG: hypothetical protein U0359_40375 [Byssovorax sp.]
MRALDFVLRFAFFAAVPFVATVVSALFPMTAVLVNIALTLVVFVAAETVRDHASRFPWLARFVKRRLDFDAYYRQHPPRPFLYYVFYPLLFPYWLFQREARRELLLYRGMTAGGFVVLVLMGALDFARNWLPELDFQRFLKLWLLLFAIQTACLFVFLLPIATTVVKLHLERRFRALYVLLGVASLSVALAVFVMARRPGHMVSWATTQRVRLRTAAEPKHAAAVQRAALRAVWASPAELASSTDEQGWVEGDALDRAESELEDLYKDDEAYAFTLHALPPGAPEVLVLQCHLGAGRAPIWRAINRRGVEVTSEKDLPKGLLGLKPRETRRAPKQQAPRRTKKVWTDH